MAGRSSDYYEMLGVPADASPEEIHSAYRRLARRYHPDVNAGGEARARFHELSDAYEVLHDPAQRARYDNSTPYVRRTVARGPEQRVPYFSGARSSRAVPRFLDEESSDIELRLGRRPQVRVQFVVRWLR